MNGYDFYLEVPFLGKEGTGGDDLEASLDSI
jgi:hypothetical protein